MNYKYLRLIKRDPKEEFQIDKIGINFDKEYMDIGNGMDDMYKMIVGVKEGDIVYFESISKSSRGLYNLVYIMEQLIRNGARVIILKEQIDTDNQTYKTLLSIVSAMDELEKSNKQHNIIRGIERCKVTGTTKTGRWFGREEKTVNDLPREFPRYYRRLKGKGGDLTKVEVAKLLNTSRASLYRWIKIYEGQ